MDISGYYKSLGIGENASQTEIKRAYRSLVKKYHPDKNVSKSIDPEIIKKINAAFEILSDYKKRKEYDRLCYERQQHYQEVNLFKETLVENSDVIYNKQIIKSRENIRIKNLNRFQIIVEPSLCMAFGSCEILAPNVFRVETNKIVNPKAVVVSENGDEFDSILDAAQTCPTKAIKIIDRLTGKQIFP